MAKNSNAEVELAEFISQFYEDPLGYVLACYKWGEGPLAGLNGPDEWQREFLNDIGKQVRERKFDGKNAVPPIRMAVSSGHGIGKSTVTGWVISWILSTRPYSQGVVTANTGTQLMTKTWASIKTWVERSITAHWFEIGAERIRHWENPNSWFVTAQASNEDRSEAFAGQHAATSTSYYFFDEASAIPDKIFEVAEGGLTDGEPMIFLMGNPTKNSGKFHRVCFGNERHRWNVRCIDSRRGAFTNKVQIAEWIADHGLDSDFVRVRVLGLPPAASDTQFIPSDLISAAMLRDAEVMPDDALVAGVDISRGGEDNTVIRFRRGRDAKSIPPIRISGQDSRDSMRTVGILADLMTRDFDGRKLAALFLDETGVGGPIGDRLRQMGFQQVIGVNFGSKSPAPHCANMRAYIWYEMRDWLKTGAIGKDLQLENELTGPGYKYNAHTAIILESKEDMKKRGVGSPDDADALAVTFASKVVNLRRANPYAYRDAKARSILGRSANPWMA